MCDPKVLDLLKQKVPESQGTRLYLKIIKNIIDSFKDVHLTPLKRIYKIWYSCFVLRFWRNSISNSTEKSKRQNFISLNCYACVEINAHAIVLAAVYLRSKNLSNLFLPFLFGSQPCEGTFRQMRSFTNVYSTVTNFTILEFMHKIGRSELQNHIVYNALPQFNFPQIRKKLNAQKAIPITVLPVDADIIDTINKAKLKAMEDLRNLNVPLSAFENDKCDLFPSRINADFTGDTSGFQTNDGMQTEVDFKSDIHCRLSTVNNVVIRDYALKKNINTNCLPITSPYVKIILNPEKSIVVRKTTLCWLFTKDKYTLSSDRLKRVAAKIHSN